MSVGKESIKRAANAAEAKPETAAEVKTPVAAETAPEKKEAPVKKTPAKKTTRAKSTAKTAAKSTARKAVAEKPKTTRKAPVNKVEETSNGTIQIKDELPVYLL